MSVEHGWCGGTEVGEQLRDELIDATIDWFYSASPNRSSQPPTFHTPRSDQPRCSYPLNPRACYVCASV